MNLPIAASRRVSGVPRAVAHTLGLALIGATALVLSNSIESASQVWFSPVNGRPAEIGVERGAEAIVAPGRPY